VKAEIPPQCEFSAQGPKGLFESNLTCETLVPDGEANISLKPLETATLDNAFYVDTRTVVYMAPPPPPDPKKSRIKVASITISCCTGDYAKRLDQAVELLQQAGQRGVDVALLPEEFAGPATPRAGCDSSTGWNGCNEVEVLGAVAKKYSMYVIFGIRALTPRDDPYPPDPSRPTPAPDGRLGYNTDIIIDRQGKVVGYYRKAWPCCPTPDGKSGGNDGYPSRELTKIFDLDFGRVGLQTCFDMNFMDTWHELYAKRVDIVFWPSAYGGGMPIRGYAALYHYYIVPAGWGDITGPDGQVVPGLKQEVPYLWTAVLDLDKTFFHVNFNDFGGILNDHKGLLAQERLPEYCALQGHCHMQSDLYGESGFLVIARTDEGYKQGISVRVLKDKYNLTDLSTYQHMARRALNMQRMTASPNVFKWPYARNGSAVIPPAHSSPASDLSSKDLENASYTGCPGCEGATLVWRNTTMPASGSLITNVAPAEDRDPLAPRGSAAMHMMVGHMPPLQDSEILV